MNKFFFYNKFIKCFYMFRALCAHHQEVKIVLYNIWYNHTRRWLSGVQCAPDGHLQSVLLVEKYKPFSSFLMFICGPHIVIYLMFCGLRIVIYLRINNRQDALFYSQFISIINFYMFREGLLPIIRRYLSVYTAVHTCRAFMLTGCWWFLLHKYEVLLYLFSYLHIINSVIS